MGKLNLETGSMHDFFNTLLDTQCVLKDLKHWNISWEWKLQYEEKKHTCQKKSALHIFKDVGFLTPTSS